MASPESTAGAGFKFEDRVVASYMAAMLAQTPARGLLGLYVTSIRTQRAQLGEPLDDVIVGGIREDGTATKLSLQAKSHLTFTARDGEWIAVIGQAWSTFSASTFQPEHERLGVAIRHVSDRADRYYVSALTWAVHSLSAADFFMRIAQEGMAHETQRTFVATVRDLLAQAANRPIDDDILWRFLRVFHIIHFDFAAGVASRDVESAQDRLRQWLAPEARLRVSDLWDHLIVVAGDMTTAAGGTTRDLLVSKLSSDGFQVAAAATSWRDLQAVAQESHRTLADIKASLHGLELNRSLIVAKIREARQSGRFVQIDGEPGSGKSACLKQVALEASRLGPVLVLKDVGIHPGGWSAHASQLGLARDVRALLVELGATGDPTLFIDGIDKITEPAVQLTVIRALTKAPEMAKP